MEFWTFKPSFQEKQPLLTTKEPSLRRFLFPPAPSVSRLQAGFRGHVYSLYEVHVHGRLQSVAWFALTEFCWLLEVFPIPKIS